MKNSKLIEVLQSFNQDANVTTSIAEDIGISYISESGEEYYTTKDTPVIFIEPVDCLCCRNYDTCENHDKSVCEKFVLEEIR